MSDIVDLDALTPPSAKIKFKGQEIEVPPPKTGDVLRLGALAQKMQDISGLDSDELTEITEGLINQIKRMVPGIESHDLNTQQILALTTMLSKMAMPDDGEPVAAATGGATPKGNA